LINILHPKKRLTDNISKKSNKGICKLGFGKDIIETRFFFFHFSFSNKAGPTCTKQKNNVRK
jgi:hypothetical protein